MSKSKVALALALALSSLSAAHADPLSTKSFQARLRLEQADGTIRRLPTVRLKATYSEQIAGNCTLEVGRKDAGSLFSDTSSFGCKIVNGSLMVESEAISAILDRSWLFVLSSKKSDAVQEVNEHGRIQADNAGSTVGRIARNVTGIQSVALEGPTRLTVRSEESHAQVALVIAPTE